MIFRLANTTWMVGLTLVVLTTSVEAQVHPQHAEQIRKAAQAVKARVTPQRVPAVLIWNTPPHLMEKDPHKGYCIPYGEAGLKAIGQASGVFQPVVSDDIVVFTPENIKQFDAIVLNNASGPWITPTPTDMAKGALMQYGSDAHAVETVLRRSLLDFVEGGGGVVSIHYAIAANRHWPEFKELFGATFTGHPWNEKIGVTVEEPDHPLVAAFDGNDFQITDEIYEYGAPYDRGRLRLSLIHISEPTRLGMLSRMPSSA